MPVDKPKKGESKEKYLEYCIPAEIKAGYESAQATAICISTYERDKMSKITDMSAKVMSRVAYDTNFRGIDLINLDAPCYKDYEQIGTKTLDGREVPNCVPKKDK